MSRIIADRIRVLWSRQSALAGLICAIWFGILLSGPFSPPEPERQEGT